MRMCLFADQGAGKTLCMTALALAYHKKGYKIFANYHLKNIDYTYVSDANFIKALNFNDKHVLCIDELGMTTMAKNVHSIHFAKILSQSRKAIGEKSHLFLTSQSTHQTNTLIRSLLDFIAYPYLYRDFNDKPYGAVLDIFMKVPNENAFVPIKKKPLYHLDKVLNYYDTSEMVDTFADNIVEKLKEKYPDFVGSKGQTKNLTSILILKEKMGISEADRHARAIIQDLDI